jgi:hypothetical protein
LAIAKGQLPLAVVWKLVDLTSLRPIGGNFNAWQRKFGPENGAEKLRPFGAGGGESRRLSLNTGISDRAEVDLSGRFASFLPKCSARWQRLPKPCEFGAGRRLSPSRQ